MGKQKETNHPGAMVNKILAILLIGYLFNELLIPVSWFYGYELVGGERVYDFFWQDISRSFRIASLSFFILLAIRQITKLWGVWIMWLATVLNIYSDLVYHERLPEFFNELYLKKSLILVGFLITIYELNKSKQWKTK